RVVVDVEVRDGAQDAWLHRRRETDAGSSQLPDRLGRGQTDRRDVDLHEVRLDEVEGYGHAARFPALREPARACVIVLQVVAVVLERVDTRCGDDAGLAHGAAE